VGVSATTANQAVAPTFKLTQRHHDAAAWLADRFREKIEWTSDELNEAAKQAGISKQAMQVRQTLPMVTVRRVIGENAFWVWRATPGWPPPLAPSP
jgi:hypothetical protein